MSAAQTKAADRGHSLPATDHQPNRGAPADTTVFADVRWVGPCDDRGALGNAVRERGAQLQAASEATPRKAADRFTVEVEVRSASGEPGYTARMSVASESGAHDEREVKASKCEELHSAVAWVLVLLARGPRAFDVNDRESDAKTQAAIGLSESVPASAPLRGPDATSLGATPDHSVWPSAPSRTLVVQGHVAPNEQPRFALGAQLVGGWLYSRDAAWGPAAFFEHQPWRDRPLALRLVPDHVRAYHCGIRTD